MNEPLIRLSGQLRQFAAADPSQRKPEAQRPPAAAARLLPAGG